MYLFARTWVCSICGEQIRIKEECEGVKTALGILQQLLALEKLNDFKFDHIFKHLQPSEVNKK